MIKNILVTIFAVFSLTACLEPTPVVTAQKDAQALVNTMTFVKNSNTNLCYGVVTTEKMNTNGHISMSVSIVPVDCEKVNL